MISFAVSMGGEVHDGHGYEVQIGDPSLKPWLETSTVEVEKGLLDRVCRFIQT